MTNPLAASFRTNRAHVLIINNAARKAGKPAAVPVKATGDDAQLGETCASNLKVPQVERLVSEEALAKEKKRAGMIRKGPRIEARKKPLGDGELSILHVSLDERARRDHDEAAELLKQLSGAEPSRSLMARRAMAVYLRYLRSIQADAEKSLAEIRTILRSR